MSYYFLVDGTISILSLFPPFFSFVLKYLQSYSHFVGYVPHSEISLGSTYVFSLAYIPSYVLIINFFLLAFFWFSIEPIIEEVLPGEASPIDISIEALEVQPKFPSPFIFSEGVEKPFIVAHVEEIGIDAFYKICDEMGKYTYEEIDEIFGNTSSK